MILLLTWKKKFLSFPRLVLADGSGDEGVECVRLFSTVLHALPDWGSLEGLVKKAINLAANLKPSLAVLSSISQLTFFPQSLS